MEEAVNRRVYGWGRGCDWRGGARHPRGTGEEAAPPPGARLATWRRGAATPYGDYVSPYTNGRGKRGRGIALPKKIVIDM